MKKFEDNIEKVVEDFLDATFSTFEKKQKKLINNTLNNKTEEEKKNLLELANVSNTKEYKDLVHIRLKLEQARLYEILLQKNLFLDEKTGKEVLTEFPEAKELIKEEIKSFILYRIKLLLGLEKEKQDQVKQEREPKLSKEEIYKLNQLTVFLKRYEFLIEFLKNFSKNEIIFLKTLAKKALDRTNFNNEEKKVEKSKADDGDRNENKVESTVSPQNKKKRGRKKKVDIKKEEDLKDEEDVATTLEEAKKSKKPIASKATQDYIKRMKIAEKVPYDPTSPENYIDINAAFASFAQKLNNEIKRGST